MPGDVIPVSDLVALTRQAGQALRTAVDRVIESGHYVLGEEVDRFEGEWAAYVGTAFAVSVASGTDALALALRAAGVRPGDEVITVSHSAVATVAAIEQIGAVPVFVDIEPVSRCLDPSQLPGLISRRTRAVVPVHMYGQPAAMEAIMTVARNAGLAVVEDCAQAHGAAIRGARVGTFADAGAFSFYPTKNLGALGDGGAVVTSSTDIAEGVRAIRQYGWRTRYVSAVTGVNSRLDEIQAAILRAKLPHLDAHNERRRMIAARYRTALAGTGIAAPADIPGTLHAMHLFVVESEDRESLRLFLHDRGISTAVHYPLAVHQQPAYRGRIRGEEALPVTERLYRRILTLPMGPQLCDEHVGRICAALQAWAQR
jgi:dTDP-4-amino-4,6-dideoxygalactose transaminase